MGTLYFGGTIYTMKKEWETVDAIFTADGIIKDVGKLDDLQVKWKSEIRETINLDGNVLYPGFVDSHLHLIGHGEKLIRLDLSEMTSSQDMALALMKKAAETPEGEWIIGEGWNENNFVDRKIFHKAELDEIAPNHPMMLTRVCRHAVLANTKALEMASITSDTPDPVGGVIVKDNDGEPTGYLLDQAQELVKSAVPDVSDSYLEKALTASAEDLLKLGLTGGHSEDLNYYGGFQRTIDTFFKVIDGKKRKFRADLLVHHGVVDVMAANGYRPGDGSEFVKINAMKIFADGAIGGRTALLSQPYNDAPETSGVAIQSLDELKELVKKARGYAMPVAIHVIGDLALEYAIKAIKEFPPPKGARDRLIHAQIVRQELIEEMKGLPVVLDIQPQFVMSDFPWVIERLGEERVHLSYAWKTLLENGLVCAGGSDAPIESVNPLLGIYGAVARKKPDEHHKGYLPAEKLTVFEAVKLYTRGSAYAIGAEGERGRIQEGFVADFTVLDRDLFKIDTDNIPEAQVVMTIVDDEVQYKKTKE